jgi:heavy metal sensor kinase
MVFSIRAKIILFYLAALFILLSLLGVFLFFSLNQVVHSEIDSDLRTRAETLALLIGQEPHETETNLSDEVMWEYNSPKSKSFFQIRRLDGTILEKSASLKNRQLPYSGRTIRTGFQTILLNSSPTRLFNFHISQGQNERYKGVPVDQLIIQCGKDIDDQMDLLEKIHFILALSIFSILAISTFGGFIIAKKALTPVEEISRTIDRISESNLSERIREEKIPTELKALALSFNRTFNRLERSFNRQRQFAADASHELRTPLSVIMSQCEITLRRVRSVGDYQKTLKAVTQTASLMSEIVRKLLAITRLGTDQGSFKMKSIRLDEILRESVRLLTPLADEKGITIHMRLSEPVKVDGDRSALLELLTNLIENAIKYNVPRGQITLSYRKEGPWIVCQIEDTGIGIPEEDVEKVFDRFYRVDKSRSKEVGGHGLGLSICEEIIKLHGGKIEIKSKLDSGTMVSVYFKYDQIKS